MTENPCWRFDPWNLGTDVRLNGIKLLVVAESHYREGHDDSEFQRRETAKIIEEHGVGASKRGARSPLFSRIAALLETSEIIGGEVWQNIYFYNYFQRTMASPRDPPLKLDFLEGVAPFDAVLEAVHPDAVLVTSSRLWEGMKNPCEIAGSCELGNVYDFAKPGGPNIYGASTHHPSSWGFSVNYWRPKVDDFLHWVRERRADAAQTMINPV